MGLCVLGRAASNVFFLVKRRLLVIREFGVIGLMHELLTRNRSNPASFPGL